MKTIETPSPEQHELLLRSAEARAARRAVRLGAIPVNHAITNRGRRRTSVTGEGKLLFAFTDVIPAEQIRSYALRIAKSQPLFDQFSGSGHVDPTRESIEAYCTLPARKARIASVPQSERHSRVQALRRQSLHIGDKLLQATFEERNTARLRRAALRVFRYQLENDIPLDNNAAVIAIDAVEDFGHCVRFKANEHRAELDSELGSQIIQIAEISTDDPYILGQNPDLLRLAQLEQKARDEYWSLRYEAVDDYWARDLTTAVSQNAMRVDQEIDRLTSLGPSPSVA